MNALELIYAERARQIHAEGWTPEHDDEHQDGGLAMAAAVYLINRSWDLPVGWPWDPSWWKPTPNDPIRQLVKAGALVVAEIERLQRAATGEDDR